MKLHTLTPGKGYGYTTFGCMWKRGELEPEAANRNAFVLENSDGTRLPMQSRITAYWPDGTVKWTAHTADASQMTEEVELKAESGAVPADTLAHGAQRIHDDGTCITIESGRAQLTVSRATGALFESFSFEDRIVMSSARPALILEDPSARNGGTRTVTQTDFSGRVDAIELEETGPLCTVIKYTGMHVVPDGTERLPFIIRLTLGFDSPRLSFQHTFVYDGDEDHDFLRGIGVSFDAPLAGKVYNRHVRFQGDHGTLHEMSAQLLTWRPRIPGSIYADQVAGKVVHPGTTYRTGTAASDLNDIPTEGGSDNDKVEQAIAHMPFWDEYVLVQDSSEHFLIKKRTADADVCHIPCLHGHRSAGGASFGSEAGSVLMSIRDFWQRYPSGYTVSGLAGDTAHATVWLWSPDAAPMDYRHYAQDGYFETYYEGYNYKGADPYGIACTSEFALETGPAPIPSEEQLERLVREVNNPTLYVGTPEFYHDMHAFGRWSLPSRNTELERWMENQIDIITSFYEQEVEQRGWYGMYDYGDIMHTYDSERHQWRYDMGGFAWDNAELVPTYWLWYQFLRTGDASVFDMAARMSRHCSEVDVYHLGPLTGLGSRHNVRHWGCSAKEARIAMAGHHRVYYYLTGDRRLGDIFDELADNEKTFVDHDPIASRYEGENATDDASHVRTGPDWSSLLSNWMVQWERTNDPIYLRKMRAGIDVVEQAPLGLLSGPEYGFDPSTCALRYLGERSKGGTQLQVCQGSSETWIELTELLDDDAWTRLVGEYGRRYYLPKEERLADTNGLVGGRAFTFPYFAGAMGAFSAAYLHDEVTAKRVWKYLMHTILVAGAHDGFKVVEVPNTGNQDMLREIRDLKTNLAAQWCLNAIVVPEFIRDLAPRTLAEADELCADLDDETYWRS